MEVWWHIQEFKRNGTSLVPGFNGISGIDPNWVTEKWIGHLQEIRCIAASLIPGFGRESSLDLKWVNKKWAGHLMELSHNGTNLILGLSQKSGSDPKWVVGKCVGHLQELRLVGTSLIPGLVKKVVPVMPTTTHKQQTAVVTSSNGRIRKRLQTNSPDLVQYKAHHMKKIHSVSKTLLS